MAEQKDTKGLTVKKFEDMPEWYTQVVLKAGLADYSPIKGCMVIRPNGYALWQSIQDNFNEMLKAHKVKNAYFPLFIPESFFHKEAEHAEGFSPEVAWIEKKTDEGGERLAIRPTSETIMYDSYSKWIRSWRDLPLLINQWANIVRWEVQDVKLFLRSREFLWQEGHCVYETEEECHKDTLYYLDLYRQIAEDLMAVPVVTGRKTDREKFAGAVATYGIEGFMPDGKALQMGTSHNLGQGFAKAFNIKFQGRDDKEQLPWQNSWGISTRMIGSIVMTHGDDKGLIIPPRMAYNKIAIIPIIFGGKEETIEEARKIGEELQELNPIVDDSTEYSAGWKFSQYELEGIPLRLEVGPKDIEKNQVVIVRRDTGNKEFVPREGLFDKIKVIIETMQKEMFDNARSDMKKMIVEVKTFEDFKKAIKDRKIVLTSHCGSEDCELKIKEETAATTRVIPDEKVKADACVHCGKPGKYKLYFARAY